jgi:multiple sugar transport system permease protein
MNPSTRKLPRQLLGVVFCSLLIGIMVFPFYWMVATSVKSPNEISLIPPHIWPTTFQIANYVRVFSRFHMLDFMRNSLIVATVSTAICSIVGALAAYPLARFPIRFKRTILFFILAVSMFPSMAVLGPLFLFMRDLGLINTHGGMIIPYISFLLPVTVWVLTNFFREIPLSLEEAAAIDGCTPLQTFIHIMVPLAIPGVSTMVILNFIAAWNEFLIAYTITKNLVSQTIPVGIVMIQGEYEFPWGDMAAASVIATVPLIIVVLIVQRKVIAGLTAGAVKG